MLTEQQINKIDKAEWILTEVYFELVEEPGTKAIAKRLDTILDKLYRLKTNTPGRK